MNTKFAQVKKQFFGKTFWIVLGCLAAVFSLAVLVFQTPAQAWVVLLSILAVFGFSLWKLEYGVLVAFAELFANSHGHLISAQIAGFDVSLRIAIFVGVMAAWFVLFVAKKSKIDLGDRRLMAFWPLLIAVVFGFILGTIQDRPLINVFNDGNGYLYLAYLAPIASIRWHAEQKRRLLQTLTASGVWVGIITYGLVYIYAHFPEVVLESVYTFVRDTRTAEVTKMQEGVYRVFLQAQLSVIFTLFILTACFWFLKSKWSERKVLLPVMSFLTGVVIIGMSRSFWVGTAVAGLGFLILYLTKKDREVGLLKNIGWMAVMKIGAVLFLLVAVLFPIPTGIGSADSFSKTVSERATRSQDAAISSRWNLLHPMWVEIVNNPVQGHGFGKMVAYDSDDPRVEERSSDGVWRTYAFEWGWFDVWLKMGVLGLFGFAWLFYSLGLQLFANLQSEQGWLMMGLLTSLVFVYVVHVFTPFLNHPLGLGVLLFIYAFISNSHVRHVESTVSAQKVSDKIKQPQAAVFSD